MNQKQRAAAAKKKRTERAARKENYHVSRRAAQAEISAPVVAKSDVRKQPVRFSQAIAEEICNRLSAGENLNQICRDERMPARISVHDWESKDPEFAKQLAKATDELIEHWATETIEISDDGSNDWINREILGGRIVRVVDQEHIARSRLRVETRRWLLSKLKHRKYGDRVDLNVGGQPGGAPLQSILAVTSDPIEAARIYQQMMQGGTSLPAASGEPPVPSDDAT